MKRLTTISGRAAGLLALIAFAGGCSRAARIELEPEAEAVFAQAAAVEFGQSRAALTEMSRLARDPANSADRKAQVAARLGALVASDATFDAKQQACRELAVIGSEREVPALAGLLRDPATADIGRIALEKIPGEAADRALVKALGRAEGEARIGLLNSLGARRSVLAVDAATQCLADPDPKVARAAIAALGRVGTPEALGELAAARAQAAAETADAYPEAMLQCADAMLNAGNKSEALAVYESFWTGDEPRAARLAALHGIAAANGAGAARELLTGLGSDDAKIRGGAARLARGLDGPAASEALARGFDSLSPAAQAELVGVFASRGDKPSQDALLGAAASKNAEVRLAALDGLGTAGGEDAAGVLLTAAFSGGPAERAAAEASLARLRSPMADGVLIAALKRGDAEARATVTRILAARRSPAAPRALLDRAADPDETQRIEALRALNAFAGEGELAALISRLSAELSPAEREAAETAAATAALAIKDPAKRSAALDAAASSAAANSAARRSLVRIYGQAGGEGALKRLLAALEDSDAETRMAAILTLGGWPDAAPAAALGGHARASKNPEERAAALGSYARVLARPSDRPEAETVAMFAEALRLARDKNERGLVLAAMGEARAPGLLALCEKTMNAPRAEPEIRAQAAVSAVQIASAVRGEAPDEARKAAARAGEVLGDGEWKRRALEVASGIEQFEDYLTGWLVAGPYAEKGKSGRDLFDMPFPPEQEGAAGADAIKWRKLPVGANKEQPWLLDLERVMAGDNRAGYLRAQVWAPKAVEARLELGSDDGIKVWLNGAVVHANNATRALSPGEDVAKIALKEGWNSILMKVTNGGAQFSACARLRAADGGKLEGLRRKAE